MERKYENQIADRVKRSIIMQFIAKGLLYIMEQIIFYAQAHWIEWLLAVLTGLAGIGYRSLSVRLKAEQKKNTAIAEGMQSLLRESIVSNYNKYTDRGYCPIYAKETLKHVYEAYHNLGGNDVATKLYHTLLEMPEELKERED